MGLAHSWLRARLMLRVVLVRPCLPIVHVPSGGIAGRCTHLCANMAVMDMLLTKTV